MKKSKNFAFLFLNELIALKGNENIEIAPGFELRKAYENEISLIKRSIPYISSIAEENPFETYNAANGLRSQKFNSGFMYSIIEFEFDLPLVGGEFQPPFLIEALALSYLRLNVLALFFTRLKLNMMIMKLVFSKNRLEDIPYLMTLTVLLE